MGSRRQSESSSDSDRRKKRKRRRESESRSRRSKRRSRSSDSSRSRSPPSNSHHRRRSSNGYSSSDERNQRETMKLSHEKRRRSRSGSERLPEVSNHQSRNLEKSGGASGKEKLAYLEWWRRDGERKPEFRPSTSWNDSNAKQQQKEYWQWRRNERVRLCNKGLSSAWSRSPTREEIEQIYTRATLNRVNDDVQIMEEGETSEVEGRVKEGKKKKKEKRKKEKKKKKKRRKKSSSSSSSSSHSDHEQWVEVTKETVDEQQTEDANMIGPQLPVENATDEPINPAIYGKDMLKGEAAAMAAYIAQGKRIPRRGEIGLSSAEISIYEKVGYVMSGTRHKSMEATRLRKENQVYSAEEKRMLSGFTQEERKRKETAILSQFRQLVDKKMKD